MPFCSREALAAIGLRHIGREVKISDKAQIYNAAAISVGDHVRIDDFCILSAGAGGIAIGRHVHIACYSSLIGAGPILIEDFAGLSARVSVFSSTEDTSGEWLTNPTIPAGYRQPICGPVRISRHALIGSGSVVLPNVTVGAGAVVGPLTLVARDLEEFTVYLGAPARRIGERKRHILELERKLADQRGS